MFDGGFAGICVPQEYGGQGLSGEYQEALIRALVGHDYPAETQSPTFTPCMAVILDFGTDEQKRRLIPPMLRGETLWAQLLSEPSGGSDVASAQTSATRSGDGWILNGTKIWTTGARWADWALCLARTDSSVPKHNGLTVFAVNMKQPGIDVREIEMVDGSRAFCEVFMTDVLIPDSDRIGEVNDGWSVGTRWMYHERTVIGGSPYVTRPAGARRLSGADSITPLVQTDLAPDSVEYRHQVELLGEAFALDLVGDALTRRIAHQIAARQVSDQSAAISRLLLGVGAARRATIAYEIAGERAVAWTDDDEAPGQFGVAYLMRQVASIGGGTLEMSRNVISERVLGLPRESAADKGVPFRDVPRGPSTRR
jgi:alkylation response protein AidB-like acyl-CoA dehydrogenase